MEEMPGLLDNMFDIPIGVVNQQTCKVTHDRVSIRQSASLEAHPYAMKNQRKANNAPSRGHFIPKPLVGSFGCLDLYGIRKLAAD